MSEANGAPSGYKCDAESACVECRHEFGACPDCVEVEPNTLYIHYNPAGASVQMALEPFTDEPSLSQPVGEWKRNSCRVVWRWDTGSVWCKSASGNEPILRGDPSFVLGSFEQAVAWLENA